MTPRDDPNTNIYLLSIHKRWCKFLFMLSRSCLCDCSDVSLVVF